MEATSQEEQAYHQAYMVLMDERIQSWDTQRKSNSKQGFEEAATTASGPKGPDAVSRKTVLTTGKGIRFEMTEEEDVDVHLNRTQNPTADSRLIDDIDVGKGPEPPPPPRLGNRASSGKQNEKPSRKRVKLKPAQVTAPSKSAVGISVLSMKGCIGHKKSGIVDLRLDSGADVTLISEEFLETMTMKPRLQQGLRMKLWQLTDKSASMKGYVHVAILVASETGETLEFEAEAYVVPGMTVPILLGEDFQQSYELHVRRSASKGTTILVGNTPWSVAASPVEKTNDSSRVERTTNLSERDVHKMGHQQRKHRHQKDRKKTARDQSVLKVAEDTILAPKTCRRVAVGTVSPIQEAEFLFK